MFFSSYKSNHPIEGELVTIRGHSKYDRALKVMKRYEEKVEPIAEFKGKVTELRQAYLDCIDAETGELLPRQKIEIFDFWPSEGDTCCVIMGPYLDWLAMELYPALKGCSRTQMETLHFKACEKTRRTTEQLLQKHVVRTIESAGTSAIAVVINQSGRVFKMPARCLAVEHKADRRTSSESQQLKNMEQLSLLGEAA